ncbi:MAG: hypothetical protein HPY76_02130, partial [Anaerolineae bacterium]|nr:hypothetical protein [Anaerolineae bacterium]
MPYARVAVNISQVSSMFDYDIPPEMAAVQPGCLVQVPFGKQQVQGVVFALMDEASVTETRPLAALLDPQPALTTAQMALARWMEHALLAPLPACLDAMLPPGLSQHADTRYELNPDPPTTADKLTPLQARIVNVLRQNGALRGRQLEARFRHIDWKPAVRALAAKGWLVTQPVLPPPGIHPRTVRTAQLVVKPQALPTEPAELGRGAAGTRRMAVLQFLAHEPWQVDTPWVLASTGANMADLVNLAEKGWISLGETERWRDPLDNVAAAQTKPMHLTTPQAAAWQVIQRALAGMDGSSSHDPILLHGVTGSGKTELYLQAVDLVLQQG